MYIIIKAKDTDNVVGLKEDIAMRLEGVADVELTDVWEQDADPNMLDSETVPYPCIGCTKKCMYRSCSKYMNWFRVKWREVTDRLKREE